ncbi:MAG: radical SAM protein [Desulfuromonadales bacterium]
MKIYPVFMPHAGCPHRCLFCAQDRSTSQCDIPTVNTITRCLDAMLPKQGGGEIAFYGGTFTLLPIAQQQLYLKAARVFIDAGRAAGLRLSTRPDALVGSCLALLRNEGVQTIEIGCQSFDDTVLEQAGRGHSAAQSSAAVQRCRDTGFTVGIQLMPGLPGGDVDEAMSSLRRALQLKPAFLRIYPTVVIAGTALANLWKTGAYSPWSLDETVELCTDMLLLCRQSDVPVIRLGLQQDKSLADNLLAGPFHPAFGQLVRSRIWRRALARIDIIGRKLSVHPDDLSDVLGHRGENRSWLGNPGPNCSLQVDAAVARGSLRLANQNLTLAELTCHGG